MLYYLRTKAFRMFSGVQENIKNIFEEVYKVKNPTAGYLY